MTHESKSFEVVKNETTGMLDISIGDSEGMRAFMDEDGTIWFCLRDVLSAMGTSTKTNQVIPTITDLFGEGCIQVIPLQTPGGLQKITFVNESGTTYLIAQGNTSVSKALNVKIHQDIIPSIRKTGRYEEPSSFIIRDQSDFDWSKKSLEFFEPAHKVALLLGLDKNAAAISANNSCFKVTGVSPMQLLEITHLESETQDIHVTPTDIGLQLATEDQKFSAIKVNRLLEEMGFQEKIKAKTPYWVATEAGKKYSRVFDTGKQSNSGTPVTQLKWSPSVVALIKKHIEE